MDIIDEIIEGVLESTEIIKAHGDEYVDIYDRERDSLKKWIAKKIEEANK